MRFIKRLFDFQFLVVLFVTNLLLIPINSERIFPGNPYSHREILDPEGKFLLEWIADPKSPDIVFNITAETKGYVALGFSKTGKMLKSDFVIAGIRKNRRTYLSDRYTTVKDRYPKQDLEQNWKLIDSWENATHTSVKILRRRETCDPHDFPIDEDSIHLLWAYGEEDVLDYHFKNRGSTQIHLLQPDLTPEVLGSPQSSQQIIAVPSMPSSSSSSSRTPPPSNETRLDVWRLTSAVENPASGEPWCVFQQAPELRKKHYIIGFSTATIEEKIRNQLDRLVVYKCSPTERGMNTPGTNANEEEESINKFDRFQDYSGECRNATELYRFCNRIIYTWGKGGRDLFLPKNLGVPFGEKDEYYLLETFFLPQSLNESSSQNIINNSSSQSTNTSEPSRNQELDIDIDLLLTQSPRKYEAKILKIGYDPMSPLFIPPGSMDFEAFGHCPSECTSQMIPKRKPIRIFGASFDTGPNGKSVGLHHFRNAFEIPLIMENKNHDPSFQQMQLFRQETPVRPGDQLTVRCKYGIRGSLEDKPQRSIASTPISSPRCLAYVWYYYLENGNTTNTTSLSAAQNDQYECTSKIHPSDLYRWTEDNAPQSLKRFPKLNTDFTQILQSRLMKLRWTPFLRLSMYELYEFGRYRASCGFPSLSPRQQSNRTRTNSNNRNRPSSAFQNYRNRGSNSTNTSRNGTNRGPVSPASNARSTSSAAGEITVHPLPVEDLPYALECPNLDDDGIAAGASGPLLFAPLPGPVIFGFP